MDPHVECDSKQDTGERGERNPADWLRADHFATYVGDRGPPSFTSATRCPDRCRVRGPLNLLREASSTDQLAS